jgi:serine/threonine-protein kinase
MSDPRTPRNLFDSTLRLETPPASEVQALPVVTTRGNEGLRTYHGIRRVPLPRPTEPAPPLELSWHTRYKLGKLLGRGSQGSVYLAKREGADGYYTNVALKIFYPQDGVTPAEYAAEMRHIATQSQRVSGIQHDNLVYIRDFVLMPPAGPDAPAPVPPASKPPGAEPLRVMVLEWIDGVDLGHLLDLRRLGRLRERLSEEEWNHLTSVIVEPGEDHARVKPGIAVDIIRGCLAGLSPLHNRGIVHCDLKPSNIMIKRSGTKKIIDVDSSCHVSQEHIAFRGTPYYMAPEQLRSAGLEVYSDIASLGYILIELLTGQLLFRDCDSVEELLQAKVELPRRLDAILPEEVRRNNLLTTLIAKMVAVEPRDRFADADAAELDRMGAVNFHYQLVKMNLATEYNRELAWWLELLHEEEKGV